MKIYLTLIVFIFHCSIHLNVEFGLLQPFVSQGAVAMTGFFMLSGFLLYTNSKDVINDSVSIKKFYIKRIASIIPVYFAVGLIYTVLWIVTGRISLIKALLVSPVEILGIQSFFTSLFSVAHNQGTWFISCLLICYFVFPLIQQIVHFSPKKTTWVGIMLCYFIVSYAVIIIRFFAVENVYTNPFFRGLEFAIGCLLGRLNDISKKTRNKSKYDLLFYVSSMILVVLGIIVISKLGFYGSYMDYDFFVIPIFAIMIVSGNSLGSDFFRKGSIFTSFLSSLSLCFFLGQMFTWKAVEIICKKLSVSNGLLMVVLAFVITLIVSIILHFTVEMKGKCFIGFLFSLFDSKGIEKRKGFD